MKEYKALMLVDSLRLNAFNRGMAWARGNMKEVENRTCRAHVLRKEIVRLICNGQNGNQS